LYSHMDITGGTLILSGDRVDRINGFIGDGYITTEYGSTDLLNVSYDSNTGFTSVIAIPEASTLALGALGLLGLMGIRRRNR